MVVIIDVKEYFVKVNFDLNIEQKIRVYRHLKGMHLKNPILVSENLQYHFHLTAIKKTVIWKFIK